MIRAPVVRAQVAALLSMGGQYHPLDAAQALLISVTAIERAAELPGMWHGSDEAIEARLTVHGMRALYLAQAGMMPREVLIARIRALPKAGQTAYSLRYEHELDDWQIAEIMGMSEDAVVALMLRALMTLAGVANDSDRG